MMDPTHFPGYELIQKGLVDIQNGMITEESLLVAIAESRLKHSGFSVVNNLKLQDFAEIHLYDLLCKKEQNYKSAYSSYNALIRRLIKFNHACDLFEGIEIRRRKQQT